MAVVWTTYLKMDFIKDTNEFGLTNQLVYINLASC